MTDIARIAAIKSLADQIVEQKKHLTPEDLADVAGDEQTSLSIWRASQALSDIGYDLIELERRRRHKHPKEDRQ